MSKLKFLIICPARSGSQLLVETLNNHPQLTTFPEPFNRQQDSYLEYLRELCQKVYGKDDFVPGEDDLIPLVDELYKNFNGFKVLTYQIPKEDPVWEYIKAIDGLKILHLTRENYFDMVVSHCVALETGVWHKRKEEESLSQPAVRIEQPVVDRKFHYIERMYFHFEEFFADSEKITFSYEEMSANFPATISKLLEFLGVAPAPLSEVMVKRITKTKRQIVDNYDELKTFYRYTPWEQYFDE